MRHATASRIGLSLRFSPQNPDPRNRRKSRGSGVHDTHGPAGQDPEHTTTDRRCKPPKPQNSVPPVCRFCQERARIGPTLTCALGEIWRLDLSTVATDRQRQMATRFVRWLFARGVWFVRVGWRNGRGFDGFLAVGGVGGVGGCLERRGGEKEGRRERVSRVCGWVPLRCNAWGGRFRTVCVPVARSGGRARPARAGSGPQRGPCERVERRSLWR